MNNRWEFIQNIASVFPIDQYSIRKPKAKLIDPQKIISLSRPFDEVYHDERIQMLRESIIKDGYKMNPTSSEGYIRLFEDSDGQYYVAGGNHRAIIAYEQNVPEIPALVQKIRKKGFRTFIKAIIKK